MVFSDNFKSKFIATTVILCLFGCLVGSIMALVYYTQTASYTQWDKMMQVMSIYYIAVFGFTLMFSTGVNQNTDKCIAYLHYFCMFSCYIYGLIAAVYTIYSLSTDIATNSARGSNCNFTKTIQGIGFTFIIVNIVGFIVGSIILFKWLHKYLIECRVAFNLELQRQDNPCQTAEVSISIDNSLEKDEITISLGSALDPNSSSSA